MTFLTAVVGGVQVLAMKTKNSESHLAVRRCCAPVWILAAVIAIPNAQAGTSESLRYYDSARVAYERLDYERAVPQLQRAIAQAGNQSDELRALLLLGCVYADWREPQRALDAFTTAFAIDSAAKLPVGTAPKVAQLAEKARKKVRQLARTRGLNSTEPSSPVLSTRDAAVVKKCAETESHIRKIWSSEAKSKLEQHLKHSSRVDVAAAAPSMIRQMDAFADAWADARLISCVDSPDASATDACLSLSAQSFQDFINEMSTATLTGNAIFSVSDRLPSPLDCSSRDAGTQPSASESETIEQAQREVVRVSTLFRVGRYKEARQLADQALKLADSSKNLLLKFEAVRILAKLELMVGNVDAAIAGLENAAKLALQMHLPRRAIQVYGELLRTEADAKRNFAKADAIYAKANELLRKEGSVPFLTASLLINRGDALWAQARYKEADRVLRQSLVALDRLESSPRVERARSAAFSELALVANYLGRRAESRELNERAIDQIILSVGPKTPELVRLYANLADNERSDGDVAKAKGLLKKSLELARELKWEEGHALNSYIILSWIEARDGNAEEARRLVNIALAWSEKHEDERSVLFMNVRMLDGLVSRVEGNFERALKVHEGVLETARLAKSDYVISATQVEIGQDLVALGRLDALNAKVECAKEPSVDVPEKRLWCAYFEALASASQKASINVRRLKAQLAADKCNRLECSDARDTANRWLNERIAKQSVFRAGENERPKPSKTVARQSGNQERRSEEMGPSPTK